MSTGSNTKGKTNKKELRNLMRYIEDGTVSDDITARIDDKVNDVRNSSESFIEYIDAMLHEKAIREESETKGRKEGKAELLQQLAALGETVDELSAKYNMPVNEIEELLTMDV